MTLPGRPELADVLGFSAQELDLNRSGRVSERQRAALERSRRSGLVWLVGVSLFMAVFVILVLVFLLPKIKKQDHGPNTPTTPLVVAVLVFIVLLVMFSALRSRRQLNRLASGTVHTVTGPARTRVRTMHGNIEGDEEGGVRYEVSIGPTTFFVAGPDVLRAFTDGTQYRAYYATGRSRVLNRLLSAERV